MSRPYYRFFPGDYLRDTRFLSVMQHGAYHLLIHEYMTNGPLPNDLARLNRIVGAQSVEERTAVETVLVEFFRLEGPHWHHKRCDEERGDQQRFRDKQRANAQKRWSPTHATAYAMALPADMPWECLTTTTTTKEKEHMSTGVDMTLAGFGRFWSAWPKSARKVAKSACLRRWKLRRLESESDRIVAHVEAMKATKQWQDGYEPAPLTYLNQSRWEDGDPESLQADNPFAGAL